MALVPVIDLGSPASVVAAEIDRACREIGFFQIVGHGLDVDVERAAWELAAEFFRLPLDEKLAISIPAGDAYGYGPFRVERLAASRGETTPPDLKETFSVGPNWAGDALPPGTDPAEALVRSANRWPSSLPGMETVMRRHYEQLAELVERLMASMARALRLPDDHFARLIDHHTSALRVLHYPDLTGEEVAPGQLRAGAHSDYGTLTLLRQDDAPGGLQVLGADGHWHDVPPIDGGYVVNVGDALERWTNDRWASTLHRVVVPPSDAGRDCSRQSLAFFHNANWDAVIECLPSCLHPGELPRYPPVTAGEHLMSKFRATQP